jgi:two-component system, LytTR family, response regulator
MKALIIDDEPLARTLIKAYLKDFPEFNEIFECGDGFEGVKMINNLKPDLVFLDVRMPKLNGFEMLEVLEESPSVIFTTAFDEYALNAFEANAIDYLLKPFPKDRFDKAVKKFLTTEKTRILLENNQLSNQIENNEYSNRIVVKHNGDVLIIPIKDVLYLESYDDYVKIHTEKQVYLKKKTMSSFENSLSPKEFVRIHRSYLVNVSYIKEIKSIDRESVEAVLKNNTSLSVSRAGYSALKSIWGI